VSRAMLSCLPIAVKYASSRSENADGDTEYKRRAAEDAVRPMSGTAMTERALRGTMGHGIGAAAVCISGTAPAHLPGQPCRVEGSTAAGSVPPRRLTLARVSSSPPRARRGVLSIPSSARPGARRGEELVEVQGRADRLADLVERIAVEHALPGTRSPLPQALAFAARMAVGPQQGGEDGGGDRAPPTAATATPRWTAGSKARSPRGCQPAQRGSAI